MSLTGIGFSSLTIADAAGSSTSATVTAGGTASYNLTLSSSGGFTRAVTLACTGAPANSTCIVAPSTLNLTADGSTAFKVTVATNVAQSSSIALPRQIMLGGLAVLSLLMMPLLAHHRRRAYGSLLLLLIISSGPILDCGGANSNNGGSGRTLPPPASGGGSSVTPPGNYTLTVKAISGNVTATQALILTVQ